MIRTNVKNVMRLKKNKTILFIYLFVNYSLYMAYKKA